MDNRTVELVRLAVANPAEEGQTLDVTVYYSLGGINYFTNRDEGRGYYLSVSPITRQGNWKKYSGFSGIKALIVSANRFNQKKLGEVAATALQHALYPELVAHVLRKNGLELVPGQEKAPAPPTA